MPTTESLPLVAAELNAAAYQMENEGPDGTTDTEIAASTTHTKRVAKSDDDVEYKEYQGVMGKPGIDFPVLPSIPHTSFSCRKVKNAGYYADLETDCQVFHICDGGRKISFLCPNGTVFRQSHLICDWWFKVDCAESEGLYETSAEQLAADQEVYRQRAQALQRTMQLAPTTPRSDSAYTRVIGNSDRRVNPSSPPTASTPFFNRVTQPSRPSGSRNEQNPAGPSGPSGPGFADAFQRGGRTFQGQTAPGADVFQNSFNGNRNFAQSSTPSGRASTSYQVTGPGSRSTSTPGAPRGRGVQSQFRFGQEPSYSGQASFNVISSTVRAPPARRPTGPERDDFSTSESGRPNLKPYRQPADSGELNYPPGVNPYIKVTSTPQLQPKKKFQSTAFPQYTVSSSYRSSTTPQPEKEAQILAETASFASNRGNRFNYGTSAKEQEANYDSESTFESSRYVSDAPNNILTTTSSPKSYFDYNRPRFVNEMDRTTTTTTSESPTPFYRKYQDILRFKESTATPTRPTFSTTTPYKGTTKYVELQRSRTVSYSAQTTVPSSQAQPTRETPHDPPTTRYITLGRIVPKSVTSRPTTTTPSTTTEPSTYPAYTTYPTTYPADITADYVNLTINSLRALELGAPLPQNEEPPQNHTTPAPQGLLALYFATEATIAPNTEVPSTVPTAPESFDKLSISDVLLLPHANENFTDFAPTDAEAQKVPSSLTQLTKDSYSSLFSETESPMTTMTPAYDTTPYNELLDDPDINSNDLKVEQSRGIVEPEIQNSIAEKPAKLPPNNLPPIGESTDLRELAQIFARALSAYLDDPESFRRVLAEVRPTEPPAQTELTTEKVDPTHPSHSDESSVTTEKDEVLLFSDELKEPAKKRPSNSLYQTAIPYAQPVITTTPQPTTEANTFPTGFATTGGFPSTTVPTNDLEAPLQRLETLLDSQSRYYSSLDGLTAVPPTSSNYTSIASDVNSLIAILSSLNESWTDYPHTAAASTDDTYFPSAPSAPDNNLPRYGGFQNNSSYKPYGSDLTSTAETSTTPGSVSSTVDYITTTAPESASSNYEVQKNNLEKIEYALGSFLPEDLNHLAILTAENSSAVPPSAGGLQQTQDFASNSLSNRDQVLETAGSQAYTSKDRYLPQQSSTVPNINEIPTTKRPRYDGPIFVTPSRASPTVTTRAAYQSKPQSATIPSTRPRTTTLPTTTTSRLRTSTATQSSVNAAQHRFRANKYPASQDLRPRPTPGSTPVTVAQSKLLSKPTSQPRLEASLDTTRRREEPQRAIFANARLSKSALQEARIPTHQLALIANGKRLPPEDKLNAHKVMNPLDINYELTTTASTRHTPATLIDLLTTLLPTLAPTLAYSTQPATKASTLPPVTTTEATAPTTYHPITSRSSPTVETEPTRSPNLSVPSISTSVSASVSMSKSQNDLTASSSSSIVPVQPPQMPSNTSQEMMAEAKSMFGHLNATMTTTLMNMLKEAQTNMTIRRLVLLLVSDHHRKMNVTTQEARRQLLEALLNPPESRSPAASSQVPSVVSPTQEVIKRETTTEKPAPTRRKPSRRANKSHLKGKEGVYSSRRSASRSSTTTSTSTTTTSTTTTSTTTRRPPDRATTNAVLATILPSSSEDMTLASSDSRAVELLRSLYSLAAQWG